MNKYAKIIGLVLAIALLAMGLVACQQNGGETADATASPAQQTLTMATNAEFPPYEYHEGEAIVGIDAEVAALIADKLGMKLKIVDTDFNSIIPGVQSGKYDMGMAGMTVTEDRLKSVNFSTSYATGVQVVIVKDGGKVTSVDDLFAEGASNKVGVQESTTGDIYTTGDIEKKGLGSIERFNKGADAVAALIAGKVDCVVIDNEPAKAFVAANADAGLKILDTEYVTEDYAICFAQSNTELQQKVDGALKELIADGSVQKIIDKYIKAE